MSQCAYNHTGTSQLEVCLACGSVGPYICTLDQSPLITLAINSECSGRISCFKLRPCALFLL